MKILLRTILITVSLFILTACAPAAAPRSSGNGAQPPPPRPPTRTSTQLTEEPTATLVSENTATETIPTDTPEPTPTPSILTFAAIADYGQAGINAEEVANLVKSWNPAFIITMGDNNYPDGEAETIDQNIGQYYSDFIFPYQGTYGPGADINRFFPTLGNHDWFTPDIQPYLDYFELPGNERYYDFVWGPIHFFALDADSHEPDGVGQSSIQAQWLREMMATSTSPWQIVYMHQPPYSSGHHGSTDYMQWPFAEWGADAVLAGHDHSYERLIIDEIPYIVNGLGGYINRYFFFKKLEGSQFQYRSDYGALRITADEKMVKFEMITVEGEVIDTHLLSAPEPAPPESVTSLPDSSNFEWASHAAGYRKPVFATHAGDGSGRLFVVEQNGRIRILGQDAPFLDIADRINTQGSEQGLLGLAFDPNFESNGIFYVNYTDITGTTTVSRFAVDANAPNRADPDSEVVLLRVNQPYRNHNGGSLAFGSDGFLYVGLGDGGFGGDPQGNAQNPATFLGKLLQINTETGEVVIYASGLRNPWRFSFDQQTGDLYVGDVGENKWEEINFLPADNPPGVNFGWNYFEGFNPFEGSPPEGSDFTPPIFEYSHDEGCSITGGNVYRGEQHPEMYGVYMFGDYCFGTVWGLVQGPDGAWTGAKLFETSAQITSFGVDESGEMYLVSHDGTIHKLIRR